ncbi:hypothetical protein HID58_057413 [Brassica napus]|uniref:Armadillo repeat-containing protein 8 n=1 Tax=Brassica napus TaxID=3708 RepID=A0ABQ8AR09_BRANA|nr:hypothetical protein HID58_057413 [Brassica napus]
MNDINDIPNTGTTNWTKDAHTVSPLSKRPCSYSAKLGAVPNIASALSNAECNNNDNNSILVQSAAALGSFSCGFEAGVQAVLDAGVFPHLLRLITNPNQKKSICGTTAEQQLLCDAGVLEKLVVLLDGSLSQSEACLESLATVLKSNHDAVSRERYTRTRLLSCLCLVAIYNTCPSCFLNVGTKSSLSTTLLELLNDPGQSGDDAALCLSSLLAEKEDLQQLAYEANAVKTIVDILKSECELQPKRLQGLFQSLAELSSKLEDCRCTFLSLQVLDLLFELQHAYALESLLDQSSCLILSGLFTKDHVMLPLVQLLHDPSPSVLTSKLKDLLVLSVVKSPLIQNHMIHLICSQITTKQNTLRRPQILSLWYKSKLWPFFVILLMDVSTPLDEDGLILDTVGRQLRKAPQAQIAIQGMYVLTNVSSGTELHKEAVMQQLFPQGEAESDSFMSYESQLRLATVWTIINLISPSSPGALDRHVKLRSAGIILQLKSMIRIKAVLGQSVYFGDIPDTLSIQQVKAVRKGWIVVPHSHLD